MIIDAVEILTFNNHKNNTFMKVYFMFLLSILLAFVKAFKSLARLLPIFKYLIINNIVGILFSVSQNLEFELVILIINKTFFFLGEKGFSFSSQSRLQSIIDK